MIRMNQSLLLFLAAGAVAAGLILWRLGLIHAPGSDGPTAWAPEPAGDIELAMPAELPIRHAVETPWTARLGARDLGRALADLLGQDAVTEFLQIDDLPRRLVATVDSLARSHAAPMLWPVHPTTGRFAVDEIDGEPVMGLDNGRRYTPLVLLVETADTRRSVNLYARMYPVLQRAYEDLGFPNRYFNDRLIAVIDTLLETPDLEYPVKLQLTEVKGPIASLRPWVRYEFADPGLESLTAGQKMLLRAGPVNKRRLESKLADFRAELIQRFPPR